MNDKVLRDIYDTILDSGDLNEVMPEATGIWEKDKKKFKIIQENLDKSLEVLNDSFDKIEIDESTDMEDELYW